MKNNKTKNIIITIVIIMIVICVALGVSFYSKNNSPISKAKINFNFNMEKWKYDEINNVYYQMGIKYCENSINEENEKFEIYVPGEYFIGEKNNDGTYKCSINPNGKKTRYTAETAPMIISIESNEEIEQKPHKEYNIEIIRKYINEGYVYIWPGFRGLKEKQNMQNDEEYSTAIIQGIADVKAMIKFLRFNKEVLPGNTDRIIAFGKNGGGTKSGILGASGNSGLFTLELKAVGSIMQNTDDDSIYDGVNATMCCSPVNNIYISKKSYSWFVEQYIAETDEDTKKEIEDLASQYANYINWLKLKSEDGSLLFLVNGAKEGIFTSGTYYDYIKKELENYINSFLKNTSFPYISSKNNIKYETAKDYVEKLNDRTNFLTYDINTNTVKINTIEEFIKHCQDKKEKIVERISENEYNHYYYLSNKYGNKGDLFVSRYWNICSILDEQYSDFLNDENMKLLLEKNEDIRKIDYNYIWARDYSDEEKDKKTFDNFKVWVKSCYY